MKVSKKLILIGILVISASLYYAFFRDVVVSDQDWNCERQKPNWACTIDFDLRSRSPRQIDYNVSIRGQKKMVIGKGVSLKMIGETKFTIPIGRYESKKIHEKLLCESKPDYIQINVWK